MSIDSAVFLDPTITSQEYIWRYGGEVAWDADEMERLAGGDVEEFVHAELGFEGDVDFFDEGIELTLGTRTTWLEFPLSLLDLGDAGDVLEDEFEAWGMTNGSE